MTLLQALLHVTNFRSPLLRTITPCVSVAFAIQAAVAGPSILAQSDRFYDFSGALTHLGVAALSLYLPALRARYATTAGGTKMPGLPSPLAPWINPGSALLNWRQVVLTTAVTIWATRCIYPPSASPLHRVHKQLTRRSGLVPLPTRVARGQGLAL